MSVTNVQMYMIDDDDDVPEVPDSSVWAQIPPPISSPVKFQLFP